MTGGEIFQRALYVVAGVLCAASGWLAAKFVLDTRSGDSVIMASAVGFAAVAMFVFAAVCFGRGLRRKKADTA